LVVSGTVVVAAIIVVVALPGRVVVGLIVVLIFYMILTFGGIGTFSVVNLQGKNTVRSGEEQTYHISLKTVDPQSAKKLHPNDTRRIIRALEVYEIMKHPISKLHRNMHPITDVCSFVMIGLNRVREELYKRIDDAWTRCLKRALLTR
jgi:tRNA dimethylallyltransferase